MTAPVYVRAKQQVQSEPCLLGTNVIDPLGLICPASGVEPTETEDSPSHHTTVRLVQAQKIPTQKGVFLEAHVEMPLHMLPYCLSGARP